MKWVKKKKKIVFIFEYPSFFFSYNWKLMNEQESY